MFSPRSPLIFRAAFETLLHGNTPSVVNDHARSNGIVLFTGVYLSIWVASWAGPVANWVQVAIGQHANLRVWASQSKPTDHCIDVLNISVFIVEEPKMYVLHWCGNMRHGAWRSP